MTLPVLVFLEFLLSVDYLHSVGSHWKKS